MLGGNLQKKIKPLFHALKTQLFVRFKICGSATNLSMGFALLRTLKQCNPIPSINHLQHGWIPRLDLVAILNSHYNDVIMSTLASQITSLPIVYSVVYLRRKSKKHQSSASLAFVMGIHRWSVNSPHKGPVTRKMFPFDDVIMLAGIPHSLTVCGVRFILCGRVVSTQQVWQQYQAVQYVCSNICVTLYRWKTELKQFTSFISDINFITLVIIEIIAEGLYWDLPRFLSKDIRCSMAYRWLSARLQ